MKARHIILLLIVLVTITKQTIAQSSYSIVSSGNWSTTLPTPCANCTITITSGVTLTIDKAVVCQNCTFQGGAIVMADQTLNIQYTGSSPVTTFFKGTKLQVSGNNGKLAVNAPLSLSNTSFTFGDGSLLSTSYEVDLTASTINLSDNSSMVSTGSASTPINLVSNSHIVVGNGSQVSTAMLMLSGPTLSLYDQSTVIVDNDNNTYYNWANYKYTSMYTPALTAGGTTKSYSTQNNTMNCGSGYPHSCANPTLYGPVTLGSAGVVSGNALPVVLVGFAAILNNDKTIMLQWNTQMEVNSSRFVIERSADGENWEEAGTVSARGNSAVVTDYSFTDEHPLTGTNFYRLKMVDLDNSFGYTEVKVIRTGVISGVSFFPNPARDYVNISLGAAGNTSLSAGVHVTIRLINTAGQVMQEKQADAGAGVIVTFPIGNSSPGVYFLSVVGEDGFRETRQLMVSR